MVIGEDVSIRVCCCALLLCNVCRHGGSSPKKFPAALPHVARQHGLIQDTFLLALSGTWGLGTAIVSLGFPFLFSVLISNGAGVRFVWTAQVLKPPPDRHNAPGPWREEPPPVQPIAEDEVPQRRSCHGGLNHGSDEARGTTRQLQR